MRGRDHTQLEERCITLSNVLLGAGLVARFLGSLLIAPRVKDPSHLVSALRLLALLTLAFAVGFWDVRDALYEASRSDGSAPERRARLAEMAEAMQMFCMGADGEMFNREGTPWPEADLTVVDCATYAREGYAAQLGIYCNC